MRFNDFTVTIAESQPSGYPTSAVASGIGRVSHTLPPPGAETTRLLAQVAAMTPTTNDAGLLRRAGAALFTWLFSGSLETHLRVAWHCADHAGCGLRLRLSIDAPEIGAWSWELLHDPLRDHTFATSTATPLGRYLDRADAFGSLVDQEAELPISVLLVIPATPDLDLAQERAIIEQATAPLKGALRLTVVEGRVTRTDLSNRLLAGHYNILHISGHGGFVGGQGYVGLTQPDGSPDWVDGVTLSRLLGNQASLRLVILNSCSTGRVDDARAFQGLAPQLVRRRIPAVIAMQQALTDRAALTFAREFYQQLCVGEEAGQVEVAVTHARTMLAVLYPGEKSFAAPVLFTHAPDGVIYRVAPQASAVHGSAGGSERIAELVRSLQMSLEFKAGLGDGRPADFGDLAPELAGDRRCVPNTPGKPRRRCTARCQLRGGADWESPGCAGRGARNESYDGAVGRETPLRTHGTVRPYRHRRRTARHAGPS